MKCISLFKCNHQVEIIDKSHCSLEDVPNFQNYSRSLEELFLDANKLTVLNENVFKLTKLRRFSFSDNAIQDIPPDIAKLINLVELDGSKNKIQTIPEQIKFLRGLQICDFSANTIEYLPHGLVQLKNLTCLTLNYCLIKNLPEDFGSLKSLESLELRENELETLPVSISALENLKRLDVGKNLIQRLPDDIGRLVNLEYLLVDGNRLGQLPSQIGYLEKLQCLDLSQQEYGLKFLPEEIGGLASLTDLHVSENHLQKLPDGIGNLKQLTVFKADNNFLSELNSNIGGCLSLQELVLTANQIDNLPSSIGYLTELCSLNVDNNHMEELPPQIGNLKNLGILSLRDNLLTHLPDEIGQLERIKVMDLSGNRLQNLPITIESLKLKALWLSKNQAIPLPTLQYQELPSGPNDELPRKVFTSYLLPQQPEDTDNLMSNQEGSEADMDRQEDIHRGPPAVTFDAPAMDDDDLARAQFVRQNTPHPRDLRARHQRLFDTTNDKIELKGHDNASFVLADQQSGYTGHNQGLFDERSGLPSAYQHLDYDDNGLPEVSTHETAKSRHSFVQNTSKPKTKMLESHKSFENGHHSEATHTNHDNQFRRSYDDSVHQVLDIVVRRSEHHKPSLGLSIAGGKDTPPFKDNDEGIFISKVNPKGAAEEAGVKAGDKILAVNNNLFYDGITHHEAVEIFKKIGSHYKEFSLRILRDPNAEYMDDRQNDEHAGGDENNVSPTKSYSLNRTFTVPVRTETGASGNTANNLKQFLHRESSERVKSNASTLPVGVGLNDKLTSRFEIIHTTLVKEYKQDLGIVLEIRHDEEEYARSSWSNIVICEIKPNSIAAKDGVLQVDDRLLKVHGIDVNGLDLDRIFDMFEGLEKYIRIVALRGDDDPLSNKLRNMPAKQALGSWFSSTSHLMSSKTSMIGSYQQPTFRSVSNLQKQVPSPSIGNKPPKPPKPSHLVTRESRDQSSSIDDSPVARPRRDSSTAADTTQMSEIERHVWRRERLRSIEGDVELAKAVNEAQRRRDEDR